MENTVFILGAGASHHAGAPLMSGFLDAAEDVRRAVPPNWEHRQAFEDVARGRALLQRVHSKAKFDLSNLESVFEAFETAELLGVWHEELPTDLPNKMRIVIAETLKQRVRFPKKGAHIQATDEYAKLAYLIRRLILDKEHSVTVVTFNYDIAIDVGLEAGQFTIDYGDRDPVAHSPSALPVSLLKLHGSLNWMRCSVQPQTHWTVQLIRDALRDGEASKVFRASETSMTLDPVSPKAKLECCGQACLRVPVIVPPTLHKGSLHQGLAAIWFRAAKALSAADNIFVLGYSWPSNDTFFHHLFALGAVGDSVVRRFRVFDPKLEVVSRYRDRLVSGQVLDHFQGDTVRFDKGLEAISREMLGEANLSGVHR